VKVSHNLWCFFAAPRKTRHNLCGIAGKHSARQTQNATSGVSAHKLWVPTPLAAFLVRVLFASFSSGLPLTAGDAGVFAC
jgi:hypothetical protein